MYAKDKLKRKRDGDGLWFYVYKGAVAIVCGFLAMPTFADGS
jgi:hypothetical protein